MTGPIAASSTEPMKKSKATVALVGIDSESEQDLAECFTWFGIQTEILGADSIQRLANEPFSGVVVRLDDKADTALQACANSAFNRHVVIYGVANNAADAVRFAEYGINAIFTEPVNRLSALKIVRDTRSLVVRELRRYPRVPLIAPVQVFKNGSGSAAVTQEISGGGLSIICDKVYDVGDPVEVELRLPQMSNTVRINGVVCWSRNGDNTTGLRFDSNDDRRTAVQQWIKKYLQITWF